jgi:taurine dioxygenase
MIAGVRVALMERKLVLVRNVTLDAGSLQAFASGFGNPVEYPFTPGTSGFPYVLEIIKEPGQTRNFGGGWHTDSAFLAAPPRLTFLYAVECPPSGGDTLIADSAAAWNHLPDHQQNRIRLLRGLHSASLASSGGRAKRYGGYTHMALSNLAEADRFEASHPLVRRRPGTDQLSLFVSEAHMTGIDGLCDRESKALLEYLFEFATLPEFVTSITWQPGTLAAFDNTCTQHYALNNYNGFRRRMLRITVDPVVPEAALSV